jgi:hypothetical protein
MPEDGCGLWERELSADEELRPPSEITVEGARGLVCPSLAKLSPIRGSTSLNLTRPGLR